MFLVVGGMAGAVNPLYTLSYFASVMTLSSEVNLMDPYLFLLPLMSPVFTPVEYVKQAGILSTMNLCCLYKNAPSATALIVFDVLHDTGINCARSTMFGQRMLRHYIQFLSVIAAGV